jgi:hypothetical protein
MQGLTKTPSRATAAHVSLSWPECPVCHLLITAHSEQKSALIVREYRDILVTRPLVDDRLQISLGYEHAIRLLLRSRGSSCRSHRTRTCHSRVRNRKPTTKGQSTCDDIDQFASDGSFTIAIGSLVLRSCPLRSLMHCPWRSGCHR